MTSKWAKGERITHPLVACGAIINGDVLFHNHKPQNAGWLQNWSISQIRREVMGGRLYFAQPVQEVTE